MGSPAVKLFNIQRFCTHDGPGTRSVVFLKGCPLRCDWCSNPEAQSADRDILFDARKCIGCGRCVGVCPQSVPMGRQGADPRCTLCGECARVCPSRALEICGREMAVHEILRELAKDEAYYQSGGGVTISGGEPLLHPDFVCALAAAMKQSGYHLALETTGFAAPEVCERVFPFFDLLLYDIKQMDEEKHRQFTGVSNRLILENARRAAAAGRRLLVRVPLLGGLNDDEENIRLLALFCAENGLMEVEFLPYHNFGQSKYLMLRKSYTCTANKPDLAHRQHLAGLLEEKGITVKIGI